MDHKESLICWVFISFLRSLRVFQGVWEFLLLFSLRVFQGLWNRFCFFEGPWGSLPIFQSCVPIQLVFQVFLGLSKTLQRTSGALWQGSYSKIESYGYLAAVTLFEKVSQPFLACHLTKINWIMKGSQVHNLYPNSNFKNFNGYIIIIYLTHYVFYKNR